MFTYPLRRAHAAGAGRWEGGLSNTHVAVTNLAALNVFAPGVKIDLGH